MGNPRGLSVFSGEGAIRENGAVLEITASDRAIFDWDSFSIEAGEITRFIQPSAKSVVLNRVSGQEMSHLCGSLRGNGEIYLINRNGIVIGKEGRVDAAAFFAFTSPIEPAAFLEGKEFWVEGDSDALIVNRGMIKTEGGSVAFVAHRIVNEGDIHAPDGRVSLCAGHEILITPSGEGLLHIRPSQRGAGVTQSGTIEAWAVQIQTDGISPLAINLSGSVDASAVVSQGGRIYLEAPDGGIQSRASLVARGEKGGEIQLLADQISVSSGTLDVSGQLGEGRIVLHADETRIGQKASIVADAIEGGKGGTVVVWGTQTAQCEGSISAQALGEVGDGGFVDISSQETVSLLSHPDLRSQKGLFGSLLIDPGPINIDTSNSSGPIHLEVPISPTSSPWEVLRSTHRIALRQDRLRSHSSMPTQPFPGRLQRLSLSLRDKIS